MLRPPTSGTRKGNGAGKGDGWGGEAKGAGRVADPAAPFTEGNVAAAGPHDKSNSTRLNALKDELYRISLHAERDETRVSAIQSYLNRVEGMPVARTITATVDPSTMTDAELTSFLREDQG